MGQNQPKVNEFQPTSGGRVGTHCPDFMMPPQAGDVQKKKNLVQPHSGHFGFRFQVSGFMVSSFQGFQGFEISRLKVLRFNVLGFKVSEVSEVSKACKVFIMVLFEKVLRVFGEVVGFWVLEGFRFTGFRVWGLPLQKVPLPSGRRCACAWESETRATL